MIYKVIVNQKLGTNGVENEYELIEAQSIEEANRHGIVVSIVQYDE